MEVKENPEHDFALDFYYTPKSGQTIEEAMGRYENFYKIDLILGPCGSTLVSTFFYTLPTTGPTICLSFILRMTWNRRINLDSKFPA